MDNSFGRCDKRLDLKLHPRENCSPCYPVVLPYTLQYGQYAYTPTDCTQHNSVPLYLYPRTRGIRGIRGTSPAAQQAQGEFRPVLPVYCIPWY